MERPNATLPRIVHHELQQRVHENRIILHHIISAVLFCAKQCIGLRGTNEMIDNVTTKSNPGNFLAFLKVKSENDEILRKHLENPKTKNATYVSPQIQNEIIEIMGNIVSRKLVDEVIGAGHYTIMADEVTSHNKEFMPLCLRFVDNQHNIREEFLEFVQVERITGRYLATTIIEVLNRNQIPLHLMRGQCYDGAANMSSDRCGVHKYVMDEAPMAPYTRCNSHALNLVIVHSCKDTDISNTLTKMKEVCMYFKYSPKRSGLLETIIKQGAPSAEKRKPMLDLCKTRWAERHHAYEHFYDAYIFIVEAMEFIAHGLHSQKYNLEVYGGPWDANTRKDASSLLKAITDFGFLAVFMILYQGLSALSGISVQLQQKALDVFDAYSKVDAVLSSYQNLRENIEPRFHNWFSHSCRMSDRVGVEPCMPRIVRGGRQIHRPNAAIDNHCDCSGNLSTCVHTVENYFRMNYAIPFIDHIIKELEMQFSDLRKGSSRLLSLVPSVMKARPSTITTIAEMYSNDLPSPALVEEEYERWKAEFQQTETDDLPDSCAKAIVRCDSTRFPNIFMLLKIACTLPVTSAECERSASVLRRLNHYTRASMKCDRLSSLALLHIHYDFQHDNEQILKEFATLHPRRMELEDLIFPPSQDESCDGLSSVVRSSVL